MVQHERAAIELARVATSCFDPASAPRLSLSSWTPYSTLLGGGQDDLLAELIDLVDQVVVYPEWSEGRKRRFAEVASRAAHAVELAILLAPRGERVLPANPTAPKTGTALAQELSGAATLGVDEVNLYNYGLLRAHDIRGVHAHGRHGVLIVPRGGRQPTTSTSVTTLTSGSSAR